MNQWKKIFSKLIMIVFAGTLFFSLQTNTYAAAVGNKLTTPEAGWERYDDTHPAIKYEGEWTFRDSGVKNDKFIYLGTDHYTTSVGAKAAFKFKGTKLRLLAQQYIGSSDNITVNVDGTDYAYSANATTNVGMVLLFELLNLNDTVHTVEIVSNDSLWTEVDAIDIDNTGYLLYPIDLNATGENEAVTLKWASVPEATGYIVKYGTESGLYTETLVVSADANLGYTINQLQNGTPYYFTVTSLSGSKDNGISNEVTATPQRMQEPDGGRAILTINLINGAEKEYDLSMTEANAFIDWYDQKDTGVGPAKYAFRYTWKMGPFSKRTEYVIFDKILSFNVDEYSAK